MLLQVYSRHSIIMGFVSFDDAFSLRKEKLPVNLQVLKIYSSEVSVRCHSIRYQSKKHRLMFLMRYVQHTYTLPASPLSFHFPLHGAATTVTVTLRAMYIHVCGAEIKGKGNTRWREPRVHRTQTHRWVWNYMRRALVLCPQHDIATALSDKRLLPSRIRPTSKNGLCQQAGVSYFTYTSQN